MSRRRRAVLLGGLALVLGGLAAYDVAGREAALDRRVGGLVDVVVARAPIAAGKRVSERALAIRRVPQRFAPADRLGAAEALVGRRAAVAIPVGADLTAALVADGDDGGPVGPPVGRGDRVADVVALGSPELVVPGSRVDVLVTPEPSADGQGEAVLALEDVEVVSAAPAPDDGSAGKDAPGPRVAASLRVTLRQAVYLAAAQDFARELRLLPRATGDDARGRAGLRMGAVLP
ncbi:MAG TPA: RcpC/CpaB family pilus assembly protein [Solirubrobacteraceae bacterium]|jgi:pilus assembly protein CpaB|nr:RcpC/CpaB family pilus assembly protein [Solirubrobacteraceae bacterium]